jgi:hypothetical protein
MEHFNIIGGTKILMNLVLAYSTLLSSFMLPIIAGMSMADWIIKILQIAALLFSIKASKNAIKNKNNTSK